MRSRKFNLSLCALGLILASCKNADTVSLAPAPVTYTTESAQHEGVKIDINSKVDILFVIDDSGSMKDEQTKLAENIELFVKEFAKTSIIDFHIGITTIYDRGRYGKVDLASDKIVEPGVVNPIARDGRTPLFDRLGHLRLIKAPEGKEALLSSQSARFISQGDGFMDILRESLQVGVRFFERKSSEKTEAQGPEHEEIFSPIIAALTEPRLSTVNKGFLRKDAQLVVILVTDANDSSEYSASQTAAFLNRLKGSENVFVVGLINPSNSQTGCERDPSGAPVKIEELIKITGGMTLDLCQKNYGKDLAKIGRRVKDQTVKGRIAIALDHIPEITKLKVYYTKKPSPTAEDEVPYSHDKGYSYDAANRTVWIHNAADWATIPGARLLVQFEPVDPRRASSSCVAGCATVQ